MVKLKGKKLGYYLKWYKKEKGRYPDGYTASGKKVKGWRKSRKTKVYRLKKRTKLTGSRLKSYRKWYKKTYKHYPRTRK